MCALVHNKYCTVRSPRQVNVPSLRGKKSPWFVLMIATVNSRTEIMGISSCSFIKTMLSTHRH